MRRFRSVHILPLVAIAGLLPADASAQTAAAVDHRVLATTKTSTMEKELNEAAEAGFRFQAVMGGESAFGGKEVVVIMSRLERKSAGRFGYRLLATSKTSTMQKELQDAADAGYMYKGQTIFQSTFGGDEVVVTLERDKDAVTRPSEYKLLATSKTSTLQKELQQAADPTARRAELVADKTALGGKELVAILRRSRAN